MTPSAHYATIHCQMFLTFVTATHRSLDAHTKTILLRLLKSRARLKLSAVVAVVCCDIYSNDVSVGQ